MKHVVFHINYLLTGGIEKVLIELLKALDPNKYNITLSLGYKLDELEVLLPQIPAHVRINYLLTEQSLTKYKKKKLQHKLDLGGKLVEELILPYFKKQVMRKRLTALVSNADVIIDFDMTLAPFYKILKQKRSVAYCHFSLKNYWGGKKSKLDRLANRLNQYDKVIMLCDEMKQDAAEMYPFLSDKLVRIYNAVDQEAIIQKASEPLEKDTRIVNSPYLVSVGRLDESQKDFTTLIKGYAVCVRKYGIEEYLVIVGEGKSREQLEGLVKQENIAERVLFTGYQSNPYKWISRSVAFLFCTKFEGLPTVLIEAHTLGKPVIATASPTGIRELLLNGDAGILIPTGDANSLSEALQKLLTNKDMKEEMLKNSTALLKQFDITEVIKEFEKQVIS